MQFYVLVVLETDDFLYKPHCYLKCDTVSEKYVTLTSSVQRLHRNLTCFFKRLRSESLYLCGRRSLYYHREYNFYMYFKKLFNITLPICTSKYNNPISINIKYDLTKCKNLYVTKFSSDSDNE